MVVTLVGVTLGNFTSAYGQFIGYPQISPVNPTANQPITFSVTTTAGVNQVTVSIYLNVSSNFCDTDWFQLSPSLQLTASPNSQNVWSATSEAGLPAGLYGIVVYASYPTGFGGVSSPMCNVFRVAKSSLPVPEFNATQIVAFLTLTVSLYILRRRH